MTGLPSVLDTCRPREDVLRGGLSDDHFAAQLDQIVRNPAGYPVYGDPDDFFAVTYPTSGLRQLLDSTFARLSGKRVKYSEHGVLRFETSFGGGKTHGLIAVYHLAKGARPADLDQFMDPRLLPRSCRVAAVVADGLDPLHGVEFEGRTARTMWGAIAAQLGEDGWKLLADTDATRTAPAKPDWVKIFRMAPTVVIIDEIAQHLRHLSSSGDADVRRQAQAVPVFLRELFEAASEVDNARVIITLASRADAFAREADVVSALVDEAGAAAADDAVRDTGSQLARYKGVLKPAEDKEIGFILQRRLFREVNRDAGQTVAHAYQAYYEELGRRGATLGGGADQPATYAEQVAQTYPFHPELIRVLDKRIGTIPNFQRARGALKLLAEAVAAIWASKMRAEIINLADLPLDATDVLAALTTGIGKAEFEQVALSDLAGSSSHAAQVDRARYPGRIPFATRACRTAFCHSLESIQVAGAGQADLLLGTAEVGDDPDVILEAINAVEQTAWHLYYDGSRYRFQVEPNANKIVAEEKANVPNSLVSETLTQRIEMMFPTNGPVKAIHFPTGPADVADRAELRLVVMHHDELTVTAGTASPPPGLLAQILDRYGAGEAFRAYRNSVVFLVADRDQVEVMREAVRFDLAAGRITRDAARMGQYSKDVARQLRQIADKAQLDARVAITRCFKHLYYPKADVANKHLPHHELTPRTQGELEKAQTMVIQGALEDVGKIRTKAVAIEFLTRTAGFPATDPITTKDVADAFWKDHNADIILNSTFITDAIAAGVRNGVWVYYDASVGRAWDSAPPGIRLASDTYLATPLEAQRQGWLQREATWDDVHQILTRSGGRLAGADLRARLEEAIGGEPTKTAVAGLLARVAQQVPAVVVVAEGEPVPDARPLTAPSSIERARLENLTILLPDKARELGVKIPGDDGKRKGWKATASGGAGVAFQRISDQIKDLGGERRIDQFSVRATLDPGEGTAGVRALGAAIGQLPRLRFDVELTATAEFEGVGGSAQINVSCPAADYQRIEGVVLALLDKASDLTGGLTLAHLAAEPIDPASRDWQQVAKVITNLKPGEIDVEVSGR